MQLNEILDIVLGQPYGAFFYTPAFYADACSYLFSEPAAVIEVNDPNEIEAALNEAEEFIGKGYTGYTLIAFETGYCFEKRLRKLKWEEPASPLMTFVFFKAAHVSGLISKDISFGSKPENDAYSIQDFRLNVTREEYIRNVEKIKNYIAEGDTYQVNYTIKGKFEVKGDLRYLFRTGIFNQSARYCAFINTTENYIISFSPELFFEVDKKKLITIPMKGTAPRGINVAEDKLRKDQLKESTKDQAENLMIVDLLRNDMGRVSRFGSVKVPKLFKIEKYETLFQMVSKVTSELKEPGIKEIIKNLFPGGSITGAPKIRTMEIINELESEPRGIYTGAIGIFTKHKAVFNLPIRTLSVEKQTGKGELGIGSGIVWDSNPEREYEETLLKSHFLLKPQKEFELFETMLLEEGEVFLYAGHIKRLKKAADFFLFGFDGKELTKEISESVEKHERRGKYRLKVFLNKQGIIRVEVSELNEELNNIKVIISSKKIDSNDRYYYFKTTNRSLYNQELEFHSKNGFSEVIFFNEKDELCEGSFTNIFIRKGAVWFTPPVRCGLLNGTYREMLLMNKKLFKEKLLFADDVKSADEVMLVNSLRKQIKVDSICW